MGFQSRDPWQSPDRRDDFQRTFKEIRASAATIRLVHSDAPPTTLAMRAERTFVSLSLKPRRNAWGCYARRWGCHRYVEIGDVIAVPAGEPLRLHGDGAISSTAIVCELDPGATEKHLGPALEWSDQRLETGLNIASDAIIGLLKAMLKEIRTPGPAVKEQLDHLVGLLVIELARYWRAPSELYFSK